MPLVNFATEIKNSIFKPLPEIIINPKKPNYTLLLVLAVSIYLILKK